MIEVQIFKQHFDKLTGTLSEPKWAIASSHTAMADAIVQRQRFIDSGISEENIRIVTSNG